MSLIDEQGERRVRMAHLAIVASHHGQWRLGAAFGADARVDLSPTSRAWPQRFNNKTNGVTCALAGAGQPGLAALIDSRIGQGWRRDLEQLAACAHR